MQAILSQLYSKFGILLLTLLLSSNLASATPSPIAITEQNLTQFRLIRDLAPFYTCFDESLSLSTLGSINSLPLSAGKVWKIVSISSLEKKKRELEKKLKKYNKNKRRNKKKIKSTKKDIANIKTQLASAKLYINQCTRSSGPEFSGDPNNIAPYHEILTANEVDHLLRKAAFGGTAELKQIGLNQGLTPLVNALVDGVMSTAEREALQNQLAFWVAQGWYYDEGDPEYANIRIWTTHAAQWGQIYAAVYSREPLRELMTLILSAHFAVNLDRVDFSYSRYGHLGIEKYWSVIRNQSLGNFRELAWAMFYDPAMNVWLDNKDNHAGNPNQNFARELLELFILGAIDPVSKLPNYDERSIVPATAFVSGFYEDIAFDPLYGKMVMGINYENLIHDQSIYEIFPGVAGAWANQSFTPRGFLDHVLFNHPGSKRYIAERIAGQLLYPGLPETVVGPLSETLKNSNYDLKALLKQTLKSSAMFSTAAKDPCITSPLIQFISLARRLYPQQLAQTGENLDKSRWLLQGLVEMAGQAGQYLFEPPSVFAWKGSCNINRAGSISRGEGWISSQKVLNRSRACGEMIDSLNWYDADLRQTLGLTLNMSPLEVVRKVATTVYGISLLPQEEAQLTRYLTIWVNDQGQEEPLDLMLDEEWYIRSKIARLVCLLGELKESNLR